MAPEFRSAAVALGWFILGSVLAFAGLLLELSLNFFDWNPSWSFGATAAVALYLAGLAGTIALHRATRGPLPMLTAVAVMLGLAGLGIAQLAPETLTPHAFLGRRFTSPLLYRVLVATAAALPGLLLLIRRARLDESDLWFKAHVRRWLLPCAALALAVLAAGMAGMRANDPREYVDAGEVLGAPWPGDAIGDAVVAIVSLGSVRPSAEEARDSFERFLASRAVADPIRAEVRAACARKAERPFDAHHCGHEVLESGRARVESRRADYRWLALAAFPIGGIVLCFLWRGRREIPVANA